MPHRHPVPGRDIPPYTYQRRGGWNPSFSWGPHQERESYHSSPSNIFKWKNHGRKRYEHSGYDSGGENSRRISQRHMRGQEEKRYQNHGSIYSNTSYDNFDQLYNYPRLPIRLGSHTRRQFMKGVPNLSRDRPFQGQFGHPYQNLFAPTYAPRQLNRRKLPFLYRRHVHMPHVRQNRLGGGLSGRFGSSRLPLRRRPKSFPSRATDHFDEDNELEPDYDLSESEGGSLHSSSSSSTGNMSDGGYDSGSGTGSINKFERPDELRHRGPHRWGLRNCNRWL
ncbi:hypothetical protein AOQ84DRAFT_129468 [Glonium stellatum]|uniref:Uncharacterized protein n=1 Tax=Glonium stellatum TaxID=574774 RepID=A0A8E2F9T1_9PEZI|nr:hypothetical protein AOQ84DRAFT_129468 [Glonium stellatum]